MFYIDHYVQCQRHPLDAPCNRAEMERLVENWGPWYPLGNTYTWVYYHDQCKTPDLPLGLVHRAVADARWAASKGLGGITCLNVIAPTWYFWQLYHLNFYALAKALWDPAVDPAALIRDFAAHYYGKAWEPMARYYELLEEVTAKFGEGEFKPEDPKWAKKLHALGFMAPQAYLTRAALARLCAEVDEALKLADDEVTRTRVQQTRDTLRLVELFWEAEENPQPERAKELASQIRRLTQVATWPPLALRSTKLEQRAKRLLEPAQKP